MYWEPLNSKDSALVKLDNVKGGNVITATSPSQGEGLTYQAEYMASAFLLARPIMIISAFDRLDSICD